MPNQNQRQNQQFIKVNYDVPSRNVPQVSAPTPKTEPKPTIPLKPCKPFLLGVVEDQIKFKRHNFTYMPVTETF